MSSVSLVRVKDNTLPALKKAISEALDFIDHVFKKEYSNIAIKPNLCYYWDQTTGQTTDPKFVAALIEIIREHFSPRANISIVESDASAMKCKHVFDFLGYRELEREYGVDLVNLSEDKTSPLSVSVGGKAFRFAIPSTLAKADLKIGIPKIKYTFSPIEITCALKNIFGCNPYPKKFRLHPILGEAIVALNKAMRFELHLVDANIVSGIQPRKLGLVMASTDPVAMDAAASKIAGLNPNRIKYLKLAQKEGLGQLSYRPVGVPLNYFRDRYPRKNLKKKMMGRAYAIAVKTGLSKRLGIE
jgi:uncharacterized protein (DUF362 family)